MKSHWLKRLAWIIPLTLVLAIPVWTHWRAKHAVNSYLKVLRAKGEKLTIEELTPRPPTDGYNGAVALQAAFTAVPRVGPDLYPQIARIVAPGKARVCWRMAALPGATNSNIWLPPSSNIWPDLKNLLDQSRTTLPALHNALDAPWIDFNLDYSQGFNLRLPHLASHKTTVQFLCSMAILDFHLGNGAEAKKSLRSAIRLSQLCASEPLMISQLVDIAGMRITWNAHWEALHYPDWKDAELADLQKIWESFSILQNAETALSMERATERLTLDHLRDKPAELRDWLQSFGHGSAQEEPLKALALRVFGPTVWKWWGSYHQEISDLRMLQLGVEGLRQSRIQRRAIQPLQTVKTESEKLEKKLQENPLLMSFTTGTGRYCEKVVAAEVRRQMMLAAIALKRYHLCHGKYPAQLSELVPEYLSKLPLDLIDGQPLRYRLKDEQHFLLYSVGLDGKDDGGDPTEGPQQYNIEGKNTGRDWVYPEPATTEEIAADQDKVQKRRNR